MVKLSELSESAQLAVTMGGALLLWSVYKSTFGAPQGTFAVTNPTTGQIDIVASITGTIPENGIAQAIIKPNHPDYSRVRAAEIKLSAHQDWWNWLFYSDDVAIARTMITTERVAELQGQYGVTGTW